MHFKLYSFKAQKADQDEWKGFLVQVGTTAQSNEQMCTDNSDAGGGKHRLCVKIREDLNFSVKVKKVFLEEGDIWGLSSKKSSHSFLISSEMGIDKYK